ncbi:hypothetical protein EMIT0232MI5_120157 [Pseudomonas sp. IT-232MI5]
MCDLHERLKFFLVGRCERLKGVLQGLCPVGFGQENVGLERLRAIAMHHEGTLVERWCRRPLQIGARTDP